MTQMMYLLLLRHALNDWVGERLAGWTPDVHLNEEGRAQANALAERLAGVPLAAVYSSPLERTVETAQPLAQSRSLTVEVRETLGETRYGDWTGRSLDELKERVKNTIERHNIDLSILLPYDEQNMISFIYEKCQVNKRVDMEEGILFELKIEPKYKDILRSYIISDKKTKIS